MNLTPKNTIKADIKRERGRPPSLDNYRKIIKALQEKPRSWSELEKATGVPKSSLDRILKFLESLELIYKDEETNMWFWYSHKLVLNKEELEIFKKHSKELLPGLALLLRKLGVTSISLKKYGFKEDDEKDRVILEKLLDCAYKHLETGYPDLYQKIEECFNLSKKMGELINTITPLLQNSLKTALVSEIPFRSKSDRFDDLIYRVLSLPWEAIARLKYKTETAKLMELKERLFILLKDIYPELNLLMLQIEEREEPILGKCPKCPKVVIQISIEGDDSVAKES
ncbi:MAG: ArsR family transcriptional regulator [Candidatus Bathyarchaeales archaeon]